MVAVSEHLSPENKKFFFYITVTAADNILPYEQPVNNYLPIPSSVELRQVDRGIYNHDDIIFEDRGKP